MWTRVLVFHIGSFGDTVLSVPALQALRNHLGPEATITLLHNAAPSERVSPTQIIPAGVVDDVIPFMGPPDVESTNGSTPSRRALIGRTRRLVAGAGVIRELRRRRFDAVVNLALADRPEATLDRDRSFFRLCGIDDVVGFDPPVGVQHEAESRLGRLRRAGIPAELGTGPWVRADEGARLEADRWRGRSGPPAERAIVTLAPATLMDAKRWPDERWIELGSRLLSSGLEPVVIGGPADQAEGDGLVEAWGGGANAAGALSPVGSAALMATAELHVGVDTGTTHTAAASGTPVVALYSQRAPVEQWAPLGAGHQIVQHDAPCPPCVAGDSSTAGHPCMTGITVDEVWDRVQLLHARIGAP